MRISDWSSDVCSSDLLQRLHRAPFDAVLISEIGISLFVIALHRRQAREVDEHAGGRGRVGAGEGTMRRAAAQVIAEGARRRGLGERVGDAGPVRSERRSGGKGSVRRGRYRWDGFHKKK